MFNWSVRQFLTNRQQQSYVISVSAFCASLLLVALVGVLGLIALRGIDYFIPKPVHKIVFIDDHAEHHQVYAQVSDGLLRRDQNADPVLLFKYSDSLYPLGKQVIIDAKAVVENSIAQDAANILLHDGTRIFSLPVSLNVPNKKNVSLSSLSTALQDVEVIQAQIDQIRTVHLALIHRRLAQFDLRQVATDAPARLRAQESFAHWQAQLKELHRQASEYQLNTLFLDNKEYAIALSDIKQLSYPGKLTYLDTVQLVLGNIGSFLVESPKQANTSGGVFPALFGTVLMIFVMTILVTPFGVLAAIYLNEYAPNNHVTSVIRICVSNMAGVPSIVYGVFGLGFFVYLTGSKIDELFFSETLPAPTMGTPGVFWASLTMAMLTLPVVIVATEEGLRRVPQGLKAGSYALGATKLETVLHTILPIASPGIMTGVILAIARAAGEVAPLMLVGAVKFAPTLPIDGEFPFLHLDRQFMHLGVLIYDSAFHSQTNVRGASMMFASCLLLLLVVFVLNILAVILRRRLRKRYLKGY